MAEKNSAPLWLQELLDQAEIAEKDHLLAMNKIRCDQALAAIAVIENKIDEINQIAEQEIGLVTSWEEAETMKLQKKINWLSFNLEKFIRGTGDSTITLAHGSIKLRKSRDQISVIDLLKFTIIGKRHGLLRHVDAKDEVDMNSLRAFIKVNGGKPPAGVILTPGQPTFSYSTTNKKGSANGESERTETESGTGSEREQTTDIAA
jgi:phage host-nuclease inhibitor protein Gam